MMRLDRIGQSRGAKGVALLIVFLTHATYIFNGFTWLDHGDILTGRALPMPGHLLEAMVARYGETSFYRPVVTLTLWLDSVVYGERSWGFHLTNVLLHVGVCASFIWAMQRVVVLPTWAILCGMVVAGVHPLSWLSVGAISYRPDLLAVLCSLLALGCYAEYRLSSGASAKLFGVAAFAALSLLSKETALFWVPALFLVWEYSTRKGTRSSRDVALVWGAVLVVAAAYVALRLVAVPEGWSRTSVPLHSAEEVGTRLAAVARQLQYVFDPRLPELSDAVPIVGLGWEAGIGAVALASMVAASLRWRGTQVGWVLGFCLVALAPSLNLVPLPRFTSPHYGYLLSFGMGMSIALAVGWMRGRSVFARRLGFGGLALWTLLASVSTCRGGFRFKDDAALFGVAVEADPRFLEGHHYLGEAAARRGDLARASEHFEAALKFRDDTIAYVDWASAATSLAGIRLQQERYDEADRLLVKIQEGVTGTKARRIIYNRAVVAERQKRYVDVVDLLSNERWDRPEPVMLLARSLSALGKINEAIAQLERAVPMLDANRRLYVEDMIQSMKGER